MGRASDRAQGYIQVMTMRNFFVALAITALFLGILLVAGTAQNKGCLPVAGADHRRRMAAPSRRIAENGLPLTREWRSGAGVEPTEPWAARPHGF